MFDRPAAGRRAWFERTLPDQLTLGRPDQVAIVFGRRVNTPHPGTVSHQDLQPGRGARDPGSLPRVQGQAVLQRGPRAPDRDDRQRHPRLRHRPPASPRTTGSALLQRRPPGQPAASSTTNLQACACAPDATTLQRVVLPSTEDGLPAPGLRFGEPRTMALLACLCCYPAPVRRPDEPHPARADRRTDPRLRRPPDDLRPAAPTPQRVHPAHPPHPALPAHQPRDAAWPSSSPRPTRGSSTRPSPNSTPHSPRHRRTHATRQRWRAFERALDDRINDAAIAA